MESIIDSFLSAKTGEHQGKLSTTLRHAPEGLWRGRNRDRSYITLVYSHSPGLEYAIARLNPNGALVLNRNAQYVSPELCEKLWQRAKERKIPALWLG